MNNSILEEIYFSVCGASENLQRTAEFDRFNKEACGYYDKLFALLGEEPTKWLDEIWILQGGMQSEFGLMGFREGIRFAFRLIAEVTQGKPQRK